MRRPKKCRNLTYLEKITCNKSSFNMERRYLEKLYLGNKVTSAGKNKKKGCKQKYDNKASLKEKT